MIAYLMKTGHLPYLLTVFTIRLLLLLNLNTGIMAKAASAPKLTVSSSTVSVSPGEGPATKTVSVSAAQTNPKTKKKYTKPNKSQTTETLDSSRTFPPLSRCANALARSLSAKRSTVSVSAQDSSVQKNVNVWDVRMESAIPTTITCTTTWGSQFTRERLQLIIYTLFYFSQFSHFE